MAEIKSGLQTSEFKLGSIVALVTTFGEQLSLFDISSFGSDPVLMLIYRGVQLLALAAVAVAHMFGRSEIKKAEQWGVVPEDNITVLPQNKTSREG